MSPSESNCCVYSYGNPASQNRVCLNAIFGSYIIVVPADLLTIFSTPHGIFKNSFFYRYKRAKGIEILERIINSQNELFRINGKE
jgi:hypothetical protein